MDTSDVTAKTGLFVALRKESVDRNIASKRYPAILGRSLSARRAWIEIIHTARKGSDNESLSARRAWIEIGTL